MILVAGVNGTGKTTTVGKLAWHLQKELGRSVVLGAADTFRAAGVEQLELWAQRAGVGFVKGPPDADPGSVAYDAIAAARRDGADVVIIDTAGRLHTQDDLMAELAKVRRVIAKQIPEAPHETLLTVDATTGQNGLRQARLFSEAVAGQRARADQARRHRQGRDRARDRARARDPGQADRGRRAARGPAPVRPGRVRAGAGHAPSTLVTRRRAQYLRPRMFDSLAEKLQATLADVRGRGTLTEDDINAAMREIRLALLEADVNFKVVKSFTNAVKEQALGADIDRQAQPRPAGGQDRLRRADRADGRRGARAVVLAPAADGHRDGRAAGLGQDDRDRQAGALPARAARLLGRRRRLRRVPPGRGRPADQGRDARPAPTSTSRAPTAIPVKIAAWARDRAQAEGKDVLIVDTSGRLHVDQELMAELANIKKAVKPHDVLLVVDAMTGQDAVNVAEQFAEVVQFDGVVMTKLDGDARGGAALSVKAITGKPILFASTGEKLDQFERFHPDRMAQRILGMGDVMTLIEKAEAAYDEEQAAELERKLRKQEFGLDDFLDQMRQIRRLGPLQSLLGMIPGMGKELRGVKVDEREFDRIQAIILSMTPQERRHPELIKGSRRLRIAKGSGTNVQAVKQLIKQFEQMRKVMRQVAQGRMPDLGALMRQAR